MKIAVFWALAPCSLVEVASTRMHDATTHNKAIFVLVAVWNSNPTLFQTNFYISAIFNKI